LGKAGISPCLSEWPRGPAGGRANVARPMAQSVWRVEVLRLNHKAKVAERYVRAESREAAAAAWGVEPEAVSPVPLSVAERQAIGGSAVWASA